MVFGFINCYGGTMKNRLVIAILIVLQTALAGELVGQEKTAKVPKGPILKAQDWPQGRGFAVGDTIPDIPLVDLEGNEVRFSKFLGKRYVLYCWASW